jgi:hypothetical protein
VCVPVLSLRSRAGGLCVCAYAAERVGCVCVCACVEPTLPSGWAVCVYLC